MLLRLGRAIPGVSFLKRCSTFQCQKQDLTEPLIAVRDSLGVGVVLDAVTDWLIGGVPVGADPLDMAILKDTPCLI
jgi:hypothetical protein